MTEVLRIKPPLCSIDNVGLHAVSNPCICNKQPSPAVPATVHTQDEVFNLTPNETITFLTGEDENNPTEESYTLVANPASVTSQNAGPFTLVNGDTLTLLVGGDLITLVLPFTGATAARDIVDFINENESAVRAIASADGLTITLNAAVAGTSSSLEVTGGSANTSFNFDTLEHFGSGDVANAATVTALELLLILSNLSTIASYFSVIGTRVRIESRYGYLAVQASVLQAALGLPLGFYYPSTSVAASTTSIRFSIYDILGEPFDACAVYVTYTEGGSTLVYQGPVGHPDYYVHPDWVLSETFLSSPTATQDDIWHIELCLKSGLTFV